MIEIIACGENLFYRRISSAPVVCLIRFSKEALGPNNQTCLVSPHPMHQTRRLTILAL
jgi:hypothetical protein